MLLPAILVLCSAALHATWNLIVKRTPDKLLSAWMTILVAPLLLWPVWFWTGLPQRGAWRIIAVSGVLHTLYNVALAAAYERGHLSIVYPVARGLAPVLVALAAAVFLGERLPLVAQLGIGLAAGGMCLLGVTARRDGRGPQGVRWAVLTALLIATYTVVDRVGVTDTHPVAYVIAVYGCNGLVMTPIVLARRGRAAIGACWRADRFVLIASGLCSVGAYLLVLIAMRLMPISYVASLRESSVVFAALLGWRVLGERFGPQRIVAAVLVATGLVALGLAM